MARRLEAMSIDEIRRRYIDSDEPVSAQTLSRLLRDPRPGVRRLHDALKKRYERERTERLRLEAMRHFELCLWKSGVRDIAGVDEVGMGPLAGPVVAAAVMFPPETEIAGVDDSKRLDPETRTTLAGEIRVKASGIGIGMASVQEIDTLNIYHAGLLAMRRAVEALPRCPQHVLVDARTVPGVQVPQNTFNKGDGINFSIAAASIIAKTERDRMMVELDGEYPGYGFAAHKGYSTPEHQAAISAHGPCTIHRRSFTFIRELCGEYSALFYDLKGRLDAAAAHADLQALDDELAACMGALAEHEQRKLKLVLSRRWKAL